MPNRRISEQRVSRFFGRPADLFQKRMHELPVQPRIPTELSSQFPRLSLPSVTYGRPSKNLGVIFNNKLGQVDLAREIKSSFPLPFTALRRNPIATVTPVTHGNPIGQLASSGAKTVTALARQAIKRAQGAANGPRQTD